MSSGERPIGAAKGKQSDTEALCQLPPPRCPRAHPCLWGLMHCHVHCSCIIFCSAAMALTDATPPDIHVMETFAAVLSAPAEPFPELEMVPAAAADRRRLFLQEYGDGYGLQGRLEALREAEFARLGTSVYLDQAGSGLYQASQIREASHLLETSVFGNPHSISACSQKTQVGPVMRFVVWRGGHGA